MLRAIASSDQRLHRLLAYGSGSEPKELRSEPKELAPSLRSWLRA
jgi:hypothetical protein